MSASASSLGNPSSAAAALDQHPALPSYSAEESPDFDLIGESAATERLRLQIERIGPHFRTLLIHGEIGTGKELVARGLHHRSTNAASPFILCHSTASWQAIQTQRPCTIFIDGVDEIPLQTQAHLLHLIGDRAYLRSHRRIIASARQSLKRLIAAGRFRSDLYHRLATIEIVIEPLRRRPDDIPPLALHLLRRFSSLYGKDIASITAHAIARLQQHDWPGNVREMENLLRNAVLACDGDSLEAHHLHPLLPLASPSSISSNDEPAATPAKLQDVVEQHVLSVLKTCSGNKVRAAEMLGISRSTLYRMLDSTAPERIPLLR